MDECEGIMSAATSAEQKARGALVMASDHTAIFDNLKAFIRVVEEKLMNPAQSHEWEVEFKQERESFEEEYNAGKLAVVLYVMDYDNAEKGEIAQTTESMARKMELYGFVRIITESEAVEYGKRRREASGGWMDSPKWRPFVASYKRLRTAVYSRHQPRLDTTTQASEAA